MFPLNLLHKWQIGATLFAVALALFAALWLYARHEHSRAERAEAEARAASAQAASNEAGQHIEARRSTNTRKAQQSAEEGRSDIQTSATTDDVLRLWSDTIDRVRDNGNQPVTGPDGS